MKRNTDHQTADNALGLNGPICRRDFLNATLLASGGVLLNSISPLRLLGQEESDSDWDGPAGVGDYVRAHGNSYSVMTEAHKVRDGMFDRVPSDAIDTHEMYDLVVVGGGISGLSAAMFFKDQCGADRTCLILENHSVFGGNARRNEFVVDGQRLIAPQGPVEFCTPNPGSLIDEFYRRVGFNYWEFKYQTWGGRGPEIPLSRSIYQQLELMPRSYGFYFGAKFGKRPGVWLVDPWGKNLEGAPFSPQVRNDLLKIRNGSSSVRQPEYEGDELSRHLDSMTIEDRLVETYGVNRETVRMWDVGTREGLGLGPDVISAYGDFSWGPAKDCSRNSGMHMSPGGMTGLARHIMKTLIDDAIPGPATLRDVCRNSINFAALDRKENPVRIRLGSTVVRVEHGGYPGTYPGKASFVWVTYTRDRKIYRVKARSVIMAGGGWITQHVVRDLPSTHREAYKQFHYGPNLRANVAVRNWNFLSKLGIAGARWFEGFGAWTEVRTVPTFGSDSQTIGPSSPTVLSLAQGFSYPGLPIAAQAAKGRYELLSTSFRDYERQIRETLVDMFSQSGFDPRRDIAGIVLNRWGHALIAPQPGFFFGEAGRLAPREVLRARPFGRIAFSHTDLAGSADHTHSILESHRAVGQIREVLW